LLLLAIVIGTAIGWIVSRLIPHGSFPSIDRDFGMTALCVSSGAVAAAAVTVLILTYKAAANPNEASARNFTTINGIGSRLIGRRELASDGSYFATEWFTVLFVPLFPICRYRVTKVSSNLANALYTIHSKSLPRGKEVLRVYATMVGAVAVAVAGVFLLSWYSGRH
jgi:hypothetical protein